VNQIEYYDTHPPRCIAPFAADLGDFDDWHFDGHGSGHINPVFRLSCSCGSDRHVVFVYPWTNPDDPGQMVILGPITLQCVSCKKKTVLIDTAVHGYDSELGNGSAMMRGDGTPEPVECAACDMNKDYEVFVRFEYPDDLFSEVFREFEGRQQDLFTWFSLVTRCPKCSGMSPVADFECA
jgi:hypothetical protein